MPPLTTRLFPAIVAGGFALAAPLIGCSSGADGPDKNDVADAGAADALGADAHGDAGMQHDAAADGDAGWPPTK